MSEGQHDRRGATVRGECRTNGSEEERIAMDNPIGVYSFVRMMAVLRIAEAHLLTTHREYVRQDLPDTLRLVDAANLTTAHAPACRGCTRLLTVRIS